MFNWIKKLFTRDLSDNIINAVEPRAIVTEVKEFHVDRVSEEIKKPKKVTKPKSKKVETPDFTSMTKSELDEWAKKNLRLELDRRKKKDYMIEQIQTKLKEK